jgi:hypothetical protein
MSQNHDISRQNNYEDKPNKFLETENLPLEAKKLMSILNKIEEFTLHLREEINSELSGNSR